MELISEIVGGDETGEGDEVPDGLFYGFRLSDISERGRPGLTAQLRPLHSHVMCESSLPKGSLISPGAEDMPFSLSDRTLDMDTDKQ